MPKTAALLYLRDSTMFHGLAYGCNNSSSVGEVVFNTAMTGYQEILTDPSYSRQIITFTYPHIGNAGVNEEDYESSYVHATGAIIRYPSLIRSNYRSNQSLDDWLQQHQLTAIAGLDTRALVHHIRQQGAQDGSIVHYQDGDEDTAKKKATALLNDFNGLSGMDLAKEVTTRQTYRWQKSSCTGTDEFLRVNNSSKFVVVYDFGVKRSILRLLAENDVDIMVVPANTPAKEVLALKPNGVLLSNGPGDPQPCHYAIQAIRELLAVGVPIFGICLGFQLLALALGGKTIKMNFGHHGANHPVTDLRTGKVYITSQNHSFAVEASSLDGKAKITHMSLFDNSLQGFVSNNGKALGFQGHPEANPGPQDIESLFQEFISMTDNA